MASSNPSQRYCSMNQLNLRGGDANLYPENNYYVMSNGPEVYQSHKNTLSRKGGLSVSHNRLSKNAKSLPVESDKSYAPINYKAAEPQSSIIKSKFIAPQFNTLHRETKELAYLQSGEFRWHYSDLTDLTPRSKAAVGSKLTRKLNFGLNEVVFKNLVPINVNDSVLMPEKSIPFKKKYRSSSKCSTVMVPDLADFLTPVPPLTHYIEKPIYHPEFYTEKIDPLSSYLSLYN